jgi:hypothetical protein
LHVRSHRSASSFHDAHSRVRGDCVIACFARDLHSLPNLKSHDAHNLSTSVFASSDSIYLAVHAY